MVRRDSRAAPSILPRSKSKLTRDRNNSQLHFGWRRRRQAASMTAGALTGLLYSRRMNPSLPYDPVALAEAARTIADAGRDLAALGWTPATSSNFSMRLD